jgi:hypothetical protein
MEFVNRLILNENGRVSEPDFKDTNVEMQDGFLTHYVKFSSGSRAPAPADNSPVRPFSVSDANFQYHVSRTELACLIPVSSLAHDPADNPPKQTRFSHLAPGCGGGHSTVLWGAAGRQVELRLRGPQHRCPYRLLCSGVRKPPSPLTPRASPLIFSRARSRSNRLEDFGPKQMPPPGVSGPRAAITAARPATGS